ncbi:MAG: hypothetical protein ACREF5_02080 [Candidatus Saccharimonadales bacterium]
MAQGSFESRKNPPGISAVNLKIGAKAKGLSTTMRRLALATAVSVAALGFYYVVLAATDVQAASTAVPTPPAGFVGLTNISNPATVPGATSQIVTLPGTECTAMEAAEPAGSIPNCQVLIYSGGANHQPVPGVKFAARAATVYWYWSWWSAECSIYGCWWWKLNSTEDGVADGAHVYNWNHGCTPSGYDTKITYCGVNFNGGGWPRYGVQYALNGDACVGPYGIGCFAHGIRQWINDSGEAYGFSDF